LLLGRLRVQDWFTGGFARSAGDESKRRWRATEFALFLWQVQH
jgi:hypothetical protein